MMNKRLTVSLTSVLLILSMLVGCGGNVSQHPPKPSAEQAPISAANPKTIDLELQENHQVHATVHAPEHPVGRTYALEPLSLDAQAALKILLPEDTSPVTREEEQEFGRVILTTQAGHKIITYEDSISLGFHDLDKDSKYGEIIRLIELYHDEFPEKEPENLDFMTMEQAIAKGKQLLSDLGVPYTPVAQLCGAMTHEQLIAYQKERLARDSTMEFPDYDPFGKVAHLTDLTAAEDSYSIFYGFSYDDLPIYGYKGEPSIASYNDTFPPVGAYAHVLISRSGMTSFTLMGAYQITPTGSEATPLTANEAIKLYETHWEEKLQPIPEEYWLVDSMYLEYIPQFADDSKVVLMPYWCIVTKSRYTNTRTGKEELSHIGSGMRFNALTGGDYANGY